jgi:uncharacterized protein DUF6941
MPPREGLSGPHVGAAFLCEKVLTERDGVPSFIRVVDRFSVSVLPVGVQLPPGITPPPKTIQFMLAIMLKAGQLPVGRYTMKVIVIKPDGEEQGSQDFSVFFNGTDDHGIAVISPMSIPEPDEGLHWFDVHFEGNPIARIPFRVVYQAIQFMPVMGSPPG